MNINEVIKYPILSEKSYQQMAAGIYTFAVDFRTNKSEVKKVVEHIFDVKVGKVNISNIKKKPKKVGKFNGFTNRYKKAIVTLSEGVINIFPEDAEEAPKEKAVKKSEKKEISEAEKKAAAKIAAKAKAKEAKAKEVEVKEAKATELKTETKKEEKVEVKKETENK